jgi:hypothetical protein
LIDAYRIGVAISMSSNGGMVLGELLRSLTGLKVGAKELEEQLGTLKTVALGAFAVFAGVEALKGIGHIIDASRELNKELEKTKQLGGDFAAQIAETRKAAVATAGLVPTTTLAGNVKLQRELGATLGHPEEARDILTAAARTAYVVSHYTGEKEEDIVQNLARVADARGQIYSVGPDGQKHVDAAKLQAEMEAAGKGLILGSGFISSGDLRQMGVTGSSAAKAQTPEAFYTAGVEAAIAMNASRVGTAETGLFAEFIGGTMTKKVAEHLTEAGLLKPGEWTSGKSGGVVINPSVAARFKPMTEDPIAWLSTGEGGAAVNNYAQKEGISQMAAIFQLFGRQTVQRLVSEAMSNEPQFARARQIAGNIPGMADQYAELQKNDLDTNIKSVTAAWTSFMQALGDAGIPGTISILHTLTDALHYMTVAIEAHPDAARRLMELASALAALVALSGGFAILSAAIGPLAAGLKLLGGGAALAGAGSAAGVAGGVGLSALAFSLGGAAALGAFVYGGGELERDPATAAARKAYEDGHRRAADQYGNTPNDGYDVMGRPVAPATANDGKPTEMQGKVILDGREIGRFIANTITGGGTTMSTGGPDLRANFGAAAVGASP